MDEEQDPRSKWKTFKTLVNLVLVAFVVILAITTCSRANDITQAALVGSFCMMGMIGTVIMLLVLVRQSHGMD
ncbi:MAG: hypothetical protein GY832_31300 [Chloroflexi bacterium]|nr:hypothetical protein [Chloroflexota bacterium]